MKFKAEVRMENESFQQDGNHELASILRDLANKIEAESHEFSKAGKIVLKDCNGNRVGFAEFTTR